MLDPLSLVGLTIAIFDELWKLGEKTAVLVSNFREFDNDTKVIESKILDENNRTRTLRLLLFENSPTYGGQTLFEQFDDDAQNQIQIFLQQLISILDEAYQLLYRRQNIPIPGEAIVTKAAPLPGEPSHSLPGATTVPEHDQDSSQGSNILTRWTSKIITRKQSSPGASSSGGNDQRTRTLSLPKDSIRAVPSVNSQPSSTSSRKSSKSFSRWRWSLLDKKRVETIIGEFSDLNRRIHEHIKLWCLSSTIGVDLQHLKRLETNINSLELGFNIDARLQIAAQDAQIWSDSLEQSGKEIYESIRQAARMGNKFAVLDWEGKPMLLEYRRYSDAPVPVKIDQRTKDHVNALAKLLQQPKENLFRIPKCEGWARDPTDIENRLAFIFAVPPGLRAVPTTLLSLLDDQYSRPSLGQRFCLARGLATCLAQLQMVKWVHKSFRSDNILFFPPSTSALNDSATLNLDCPWILGFESSRPEDDFTDGRADSSPSRNIYRHPDRQMSPQKPFSKIHDIYALGVVLLEIGVWQAAITLRKDGFKDLQDPIGIQQRLIHKAEKNLGSRMGEKYKTVVVRCLKGDFNRMNDTKDDLKLQQSFRTNVVDVLQRAAEIL